MVCWGRGCFCSLGQKRNFLALADKMPYISSIEYGVPYDEAINMSSVQRMPVQAEPLVLSYMGKGGKIAVEAVASGFGMSKGQLAETAGLSKETFYRTARSNTARTQGRLLEMLEIISRVADWAGGKEQAMAWYRAQPLPAFGGRTAEALVKDGKAAAVRDYLDHMAVGGFA
jgi:uncharacterized protein (DUF2384 family)